MTTTFANKRIHVRELAVILKWHIHISGRSMTVRQGQLIEIYIKTIIICI